MKILIPCTGNSCRSQMAQGFLQSFNERSMVRFAGIEAVGRVKPRLNIGFEDPPNARKPEDFINSEYLRVSDEIH